MYTSIFVCRNSLLTIMLLPILNIIYTYQENFSFSSKLLNLKKVRTI